MPILGSADCYECEGEKTVRLVVDGRGVWSRCFRCGFTEWEWALGDNPAYLDCLAEKYRVDKEAIVDALEEAG
ncbi:hypothetical protein [Candidatus Hecatella orcuttiae]|jgi:hypothetical protein|uniref:hypothetical protein n=1 Tax=Candidatus Hecatella orcuttiae TaxID=1935119 RepID=UPI00286824B2|nr:hypothetical protein [Candidatus Hecatella orcuttiae]